MSTDANQNDDATDNLNGTDTHERWWVRRLLVKTIRLVLICYTGVLVALVVLETQLVYPGAYMGDDASVRSPLQVVKYTTEDDVQLKGVLIHKGSSKPVILFFHGNGEKATWQHDWLIRLSDQFDANVMAAEYRGYIDDTPKPHEAGLLKDASAARKFLMKQYNLKANDIVLYGRSLGGGCAVALAQNGGAKALILERTFDRLVDVAAGKYSVLPISLLMHNRFDSLQRIKDYDGPLVQIHGTTDRLIPIDHGRRLHAASTSKVKHWIEVPGLGHNDPITDRVLSNIAAKERDAINGDSSSR